MNVTMTGTLVRFTRSKLEMFAIPATAIITALIGLSRRPTLAAFCIPRRIVVALPPKSAAKLGTRGANANIEATPEPITMLRPVMIADTITPTTSAEIARPWIAATNSLRYPRKLNRKRMFRPQRSMLQYFTIGRPYL